jgi:hypothetical protein
LGAGDQEDEPTVSSTASAPSRQASATGGLPTSGAARTSVTTNSSSDVAGLRRELAELREEVVRLKKDVEDLWANVR